MNRSIRIIIKPMVLLLLFIALSFFSPSLYADDLEYIKWLEDQSMLKKADSISREYSASVKQWKHPYAIPQHEKVVSLASAWFTAYPASIITQTGENIVQALSSEDLWKAFKEIGIDAVHTGPMERSGGITGRNFTPSVDGQFDRIGIDIDPIFGSDRDFIRMSETAKKYGSTIAGDIVPGHTGKGPDFRLAERKYKDYPGIYNMIEIKKEDWALLPDVPQGADSINIPPAKVETLIKKGYLTGKLERIIFYEKGVKESNWSATGIVKGVDGSERRWVYLHYFKAGQPTLNWLDPSFAANRLIAGDIINSISNLKARIIRLDANGFLGIEKTPGSLSGWSEGHPLAVVSSNLIAMTARKFGGFTFQELNLSLENLRKFSEDGADLSYDFITRPAYFHALITQDAGFLKIMFKLMNDYRIKPLSLIHAMQNHDELTYELVHFYCHKNTRYKYHNRKMTGFQLRNLVQKESKDAVTGKNGPYNLLLGDGICTTMTGLCSAVLKIKDPYNMNDNDKNTVKKMHLLMVMYNAMQPGVFAISGWDLTGALPLKPLQVRELLSDGDNRWVNRGAYDLTGKNPGADRSTSGLPRAVCLYGSLPQQLKEPLSFASQLKKILNIRKKYKIHLSDLISVPEVKNKSIFVIVNRLPEKAGIELTALNFGKEPVKENIIISQIKGLKGENLLIKNEVFSRSTNGRIILKLGAFEGKAILFRN